MSINPDTVADLQAECEALREDNALLVRENERLLEIIAQLLDNTHSHAVRRRAEAALKGQT